MCTTSSEAKVKDSEKTVQQLFLLSVRNYEEAGKMKNDSKNKSYSWEVMFRVNWMTYHFRFLRKFLRLDSQISSLG